MNDVTLYLGDCLDVLRDLPSGSVDAVVTDPPWGLGFAYGRRADVTRFDPEEYWTWFRPVLHEMRRVLVSGGLLACWQAKFYFRYLWDWFGEDIHIFAAGKNFVQLRKTLPINFAWEPVVLNYKGGDVPRRPTQPSRNLDFHIGNTAAMVSDPTRPEREHPCPRPIDTVQNIVDNFTIPNGTVLDPFMGSGTTGVACVQTGRRFIGIEIDPGYYAMAEKRIAEAQAQLRMPMEGIS